MGKSRFIVEFPSYAKLIVSPKDGAALADILERSRMVESQYDPRRNVYDQYLVDTDKEVEMTLKTDIDVKLMSAEDWEKQKEIFLEIERREDEERAARAIDTEKTCESSEDAGEVCQYDPQEDPERRRCIKCRQVIEDEYYASHA